MLIMIMIRKYDVRITQHYKIEGVEADSEEEARTTAAEDFTWDEHLRDTIFDVEQLPDEMTRGQKIACDFYIAAGGNRDTFLKWLGGEEVEWDADIATWADLRGLCHIGED